MGEEEDKIIEYAKKQLEERQHEFDKKEKRYFKQLAKGLCGKCGKPLKVTSCYYALRVKDQELESPPEEILAKGDLKGESFSLSCCDDVVETVPYDTNSQLKTSLIMTKFGDVRFSIREIEEDKQTTEERELALAGKFTEKEYSEYKDLEKAEEYSPIDITAHKIDRSDQIPLQITTLNPGAKLWKALRSGGYKDLKYDPEGTESDLIECLDKKKYDPAVCNELILLIDTWPYTPEKVKERLSGKELPLLQERNYREVWLIHKDTGETARIWPV